MWGVPDAVISLGVGRVPIIGLLALGLVLEVEGERGFVGDRLGLWGILGLFVSDMGEWLFILFMLFMLSILSVRSGRTLSILLISL
jgi:hypothetical protein